METIFFGENLGNLFLNEIIKEYDNIDTSHKTNLELIDVTQFIILKGKTSISNPINYSKLFRNYMESKIGVENNYSIIDLIEYGSSINYKDVIVKSVFDSNSLYPNRLFLDSHQQGEYVIDDIQNIIYTTSESLYSKILLEGDYSQYINKRLKNNKSFICDKFYGMSLSPLKIYETYLKYISHNLFEKQLCKDISYNLYYEGDINKLNWETMSFVIDSNSLVVNKEWVKSLILDLFDFNINHVKKHLSLDKYDFENDITGVSPCWKVRDRTSEMVLL
jgi:hypothetical protein